MCAAQRAKLLLCDVVLPTDSLRTLVPVALVSCASTFLPLTLLRKRKSPLWGHFVCSSVSRLSGVIMLPSVGCYTKCYFCGILTRGRLNG
jgi:hypothetical protein